MRAPHVRLSGNEGRRVVASRKQEVKVNSISGTSRFYWVQRIQTEHGNAAKRSVDFLLIDSERKVIPWRGQGTSTRESNDCETLTDFAEAVVQSGKLVVSVTSSQFDSKGEDCHDKKSRKVTFEASL
jgi:hypothetical protein